MLQQNDQEIKDQKQQLKSEIKKDYLISEWLSRKAEAYLGKKTAVNQRENMQRGQIRDFKGPS